MIKTFRGLLLDDEQNRIRLSTKKGKIGYRIIKFQIFSYAPGVKQSEHVVKIFKVKQTTVTGLVDFSDGNLLGAAYLETTDSPTTPDNPQNTIFEQEVFNQDIFITQADANGSDPCNYYLELETMSLTDNAASVSTLRDIRLNPQVGE